MAWRTGAGKVLLSLLRKGGPSDPVAPRLLAAAGAALGGASHGGAGAVGEVGLMAAGAAAAACLRASADLGALPGSASGGPGLGAGSEAAGAAWARGGRLAAAAVDFLCEVFAGDGPDVSLVFGRSGAAGALGDVLEGGLLRAPGRGTAAADAANLVSPWVCAACDAAAANGPALIEFRK